VTVNNLIAGLNWAIERDESLHQVLRGLAGKRIRVLLPAGAVLDWAIEADGLLQDLSLAGSESAAHSPHVVIQMNTGLSGASASGAARGVRIEGDASVAERLGPLLNLVKERVSPWEHFWNNSPAGLLAKQVADYAMHEARVVVSRDQADQHQAQLRQLRDAIDRLEKRIDQFERTRSL
jgi:ubiquinone biosynthesis protein UbiJ